MKLKYILAVVLLSITFNQINAQDSSNVHSGDNSYVLDQYYKLNLKVFQAGSTPEDVDNIFELFTDDFTYVHPQYEAQMALFEFKDGMISRIYEYWK